MVKLELPSQAVPASNERSQQQEKSNSESIIAGMKEIGTILLRRGAFRS